MDTPLVCTYFATDWCKYIVLVYKENLFLSFPIKNSFVSPFIEKVIIYVS